MKRFERVLKRNGIFEKFHILRLRADLRSQQFSKRVRREFHIHFKFD